MQLTDKQVRNFQALYQAHFGEQLSFEEASEQGLRLLTIMRHVYKPMTEQEYQKLGKDEYEPKRPAKDI